MQPEFRTSSSVLLSVDIGYFSTVWSDLVRFSDLSEQKRDEPV